MYRTKKVHYKGREVSILLQGENGPCALLAVANILLLRGEATFNRDLSVITAENVVQCIGNVLLDRSTSRQFSAVNHAISLLPRLDEGLHVNVKFSSIDAFEPSPELDIFNLLQIQLYHCWLPSEEDPAFPYLVSSDFDRLQVSLAEYDSLKSQLESGTISELTVAQETMAGEAQTVERWFELNSGQITAEGLFALAERIHEDELSVLFRNNHFSTITKHRGSLYLLITDEGFHGTAAVWESFNQLDGDALFLSSLSQHSNDFLLEPHFAQPHISPAALTSNRSPAAANTQQCRCCSVM
jgi:hypothetical protein